MMRIDIGPGFVRLSSRRLLNTSTDVTTNVLRRHLNQFLPSLNHLGPDDLTLRYFRSRDSECAGVLLFQFLHEVGHDGQGRDKLARNLLRLWEGELAIAHPLALGYNLTAVDVFEKLCRLIHPHYLHGSTLLFEQVCRFLVLAFDSMAQEDSHYPVRCLLAVDALDRYMDDVIEQLAATSRCLRRVVLQEPYLLNGLSAPTQRALARCCYGHDGAPWDVWDEPLGRGGGLAWRAWRSPAPWPGRPDLFHPHDPWGRRRGGGLLPDLAHGLRDGSPRGRMYVESAYGSRSRLQLNLKRERSPSLSLSPIRRGHVPLLPGPRGELGPLDDFVPWNLGRLPGGRLPAHREWPR